MGKKIVINLNDSKTIKKGIDELRQFSKDIETACELYVEEMGRKGVEIASYKIIDMKAIFTGELLASTKVVNLPRIPKGYSCLIINDCEHAAFVEFGTGYVGESNPYPHPLPQGVTWEYKVGEQLLGNAEKGIYGWWYVGEDGKSYFTKGMASRPFMTETSIDLISIAESTAKRIFGIV